MRIHPISIRRWLGLCLALSGIVLGCQVSSALPGPADTPSPTQASSPTASSTPTRAASATPTLTQQPVTQTPTRVLSPTRTATYTRAPTLTRTVTATFRPLLQLQTPAMQGLDVISVKSHLNSLGYAEVGAIDAEFNAQMDAAVRHFQFLNQLTVTGKVDEATRAAIFGSKAQRFYLPPPFPGRNLGYSPSVSLEDDHALQERLAELGYLEPGGAEWDNNAFGKATQNAVLKYQQVNKLDMNGVVDYAAWQRLFSPLALNARGEGRTRPPAAWKTTIYPLQADPLALAFDGKRLWVLADSSVYGRGTLLIPVDPNADALVMTAPVFPGEARESDNQVVNMIFARRLLWLQFPRAQEPQPQALLTSFNPDMALPVQRTRLGENQEANAFPSSALGFDGARIWMSAGERLWKVNPAGAVVEDSVEAGWLAHGKVVSDGVCLWVGVEAGVTSLHPEGGQCPGNENSYSIAGTDIVFDGKLIWITDGMGFVVPFDPTKGEAGEALFMGTGASALAFDGKRIWVADSDHHTVQAFDPKTRQTGPAIAVGGSPNLLLFDGKRLWVANKASQTVQYLLVEE